MDAAKTPITTDRQILFAAAAIMAVVSVYATRSADPDMWGHLRYGRFFTENGIVSTDPFAYTSAEFEWFPAEYGSQLVLWQAYAFGGATGLIILKCLFGGAAVFFLYRALRAGADDPRIWAPILILAAGIIARSFLLRPQLFSFMFFCYVVMILFRHALARAHWLWLVTLPPVFAVWANMHGAFMAGLGAIGLMMLLHLAQSWCRYGFHVKAAWRAAWPLALLFGLCLAATLLNPLGWRMWEYFITEMTHDTNRRLIEEWRPPEWPTHAWSLLTLFLLLAGLLFAGIVAQFRQKASSPPFTADESATAVNAGLCGLPAWVWLLSCVPLTYMAFQAVRHIPVFAIWAAPVLTVLAQRAFGRENSSSLASRGWLVFTFLVAMPAVLTVSYVVNHPQPRISLEGRTALGETKPYRVTAFIRDNDLRGNFYNPLQWGSYLTWELYPNIRVAMDGRNVTLFSSEMVEENLHFFGKPADQVDLATPLKYATDFLLVPADSPILERVHSDENWFEIYQDNDSVLFVRADSAHEEVMRRAKAGELRRPGNVAPRYFE